MRKIYDPMIKLRENPKSLRAAINAKCWDCQGCDSDPAPRWRIGNCVMGDCPLYFVRPYLSNQHRPMPAVLRPEGALGDSDLINSDAAA